MEFIQKRNGVFETNSSSTHSICVAKNTNLTLPESIHFGFDEFGWSFDELRSISEKANYLYTGLIVNDMIDEFNKIVEELRSKNIEVTFDDSSDDNGYVDQPGELHDFLVDICNDSEKLMNYLFSPLSFVLTGNDNSDMDNDIYVDYDHDEYYKGN